MSGKDPLVVVLILFVVICSRILMICLSWMMSNFLLKESMIRWEHLLLSHTRNLDRKENRCLDFDAKRGLDRSSRKIDPCDFRIDSLPTERRRNENLKRNNLASFEEHSIYKELSSLREQQAKIHQVIEKLQNELADERRFREAILVELRSRGILLGSISSPSTILPTSTKSPVFDSDSKYKELKKKLLMANLKILDLQNRKT